jgi:hypothetical protein
MAAQVFAGLYRRDCKLLLLRKYARVANDLHTRYPHAPALSSSTHKQMTKLLLRFDTCLVFESAISRIRRLFVCTRCGAV